MITFALDIDLTLAEGFLAHLRYLNSRMQLALPEPELLRMTSYEDFNARPEVQAFARTQRAAYLQAVAAVKEDIPTLLAKQPLPFAVERVNELARRGTVKYLTIRKSHDPATQEQMYQATRDWLRQHGFPSPDAVLFPKTFVAKLIAAVQNTRGPVFLVDDRWQDLLQAFQALPTKVLNGTAVQEHVRQRLTLVAFGASSLPESDTGLRILPLISWEHTEVLSSFVRSAL